MLRPPPVPDQVLSTTRRRMIRARLLQATAEVAAERGVHRITISSITQRAGATTEAFREHYASAEECLQASFQAALDTAASRVLPAYRQAGDWPEAIGDGLLAFLEFADRQPAFARLLIVEAQHAPKPIARRRAETIRLLVRAVDDGRLLSAHPQSLRPMTAEAILGGLIGVIGERLQNGRGSLTGLHSRLLSVILLAYLGAEQASRALRRKPPGTQATTRPAKATGRRGVATAQGKPQAAARKTRADNARRDAAGKHAGGRLVLTARTAMVLQVIAEHPGLTNRQVQVAAGIATAGDISKLLGRLQRHGVILNTGRPGRGGRNCWHLTEQGAWVGQAAGTANRTS